MECYSRSQAGHRKIQFKSSNPRIIREDHQDGASSEVRSSTTISDQMIVPALPQSQSGQCFPDNGGHWCEQPPNEQASSRQAAPTHSSNTLLKKSVTLLESLLKKRYKGQSDRQVSSQNSHTAIKTQQGRQEVASPDFPGVMAIVNSTNQDIIQQAVLIQQDSNGMIQPQSLQYTGSLNYESEQTSNHVTPTASTTSFTSNQWMSVPQNQRNYSGSEMGRNQHGVGNHTHPHIPPSQMSSVNTLTHFNTSNNNSQVFVSSLNMSGGQGLPVDQQSKIRSQDAAGRRLLNVVDRLRAQAVGNSVATQNLLEIPQNGNSESNQPNAETSKYRYRMTIENGFVTGVHDQMAQSETGIQALQHGPNQVSSYATQYASTSNYVNSSCSNSVQSAQTSSLVTPTATSTSFTSNQWMSVPQNQRNSRECEMSRNPSVYLHTHPHTSSQKSQPFNIDNGNSQVNVSGGQALPMLSIGQHSNRSQDPSGLYLAQQQRLVNHENMNRVHAHTVGNGVPTQNPHQIPHFQSNQPNTLSSEYRMTIENGHDKMLLTRSFPPPSYPAPPPYNAGQGFYSKHGENILVLQGQKQPYVNNGSHPNQINVCHQLTRQIPQNNIRAQQSAAPMSFTQHRQKAIAVVQPLSTPQQVTPDALTTSKPVESLLVDTTINTTTDTEAAANPGQVSHETKSCAGAGKHQSLLAESEQEDPLIRLRSTLGAKDEVVRTLDSAATKDTGQSSPELLNAEEISESESDTVVNQVPVNHASEKTKKTKGPVTLSENTYKFCSVPVVPWTYKKLTALLTMLSCKELTKNGNVAETDVASTILARYWGGNYEGMMDVLRTGYYKNILIAAEEMSRERESSETVIFSQIKHLARLKNDHHVLGHNDVYPTMEHKSSWLNTNDQLDDIDKEFGFPWCLKQNQEMPPQEEQPELMGTEDDRSAPANEMRDVMHKVMPQTKSLTPGTEINVASEIQDQCLTQSYSQTETPPTLLVDLVKEYFSQRHLKQNQEMPQQEEQPDLMGTEDDRSEAASEMREVMPPPKTLTPEPNGACEIQDQCLTHSYSQTESPLKIEYGPPWSTLSPEEAHHNVEDVQVQGEQSVGQQRVTTLGSVGDKLPIEMDLELTEEKLENKVEKQMEIFCCFSRLMAKLSGVTSAISCPCQSTSEPTPGRTTLNANYLGDKNLYAMNYLEAPKVQVRPETEHQDSVIDQDGNGEICSNPDSKGMQLSEAPAVGSKSNVSMDTTVINPGEAEAAFKVNSCDSQFLPTENVSNLTSPPLIIQRHYNSLTSERNWKVKGKRAFGRKRKKCAEHLPSVPKKQRKINRHLQSTAQPAVHANLSGNCNMSTGHGYVVTLALYGSSPQRKYGTVRTGQSKSMRTNPFIGRAPTPPPILNVSVGSWQCARTSAPFTGLVMKSPEVKSPEHKSSVKERLLKDWQDSFEPIKTNKCRQGRPSKGRMKDVVIATSVKIGTSLPAVPGGRSTTGSEQSWSRKKSILNGLRLRLTKAKISPHKMVENSKCDTWNPVFRPS